jgi:hypothetical protein
MDAAFSAFPTRSKTDNPKRLQEEMNKVNAPYQMAHYGHNPMIS